MNRRVAIGLLGAGVGGVLGAGWIRSGMGASVAEVALAFGEVRTDGVARWLSERRAEGYHPATLIRGMTLAGVRFGADQGDIHHLLVGEPTLRLAAAIDASEAEVWSLVLWVGLHASEWVSQGDGLRVAGTLTPKPGAGASLLRAVWERDADAAEASALALTDAEWAGAWLTATALHPDPHLAIYASEIGMGERGLWGPSLARRIADRPSDAEPGFAALQAALQLAHGPPSEPRSPDLGRQIAKTVLGDGAAVTALATLDDVESLWDGVFLAATVGAGARGASVNGIHALTLTAAIYRLSSGSREGALSAAMRLSTLGPVLLFTDADRTWGHQTDRQVDRQVDRQDVPTMSAFHARGRAPGADMHDIKYVEALLTACRGRSAAVQALMRAGAAGSDKLDAAEPWDLHAAAHSHFA